MQVIFIGVAGGSASGKTAIARALSDKFAVNSVPVISMDWYYKALSDPSLGPTHDWDSPDAFDIPAIISAIIGWKSGEPQWTPRHDYASYTRREKVQRIESAPVMILEGILTFHDKALSELLDHKIFIECDSDIAILRRVNRDMAERGYTHSEITERYITCVKPAFDKWIVPQKKSATMIIDNSDNSRNPSELAALDMVAAFIDQAQTRGRSRERASFNCDRSKRFSSR